MYLLHILLLFHYLDMHFYRSKVQRYRMHTIHEKIQNITPRLL